ncbi:hypothetical protein BT93_A2161 [Corymbia citriodora subsp. variegata]|nr:hypothetical protein BT93_A2161 [Corymbia citriodora subsp. variegata]
MEEAVVLYPSPAIGHLISMVELGKLLLSHRPSLSVHVLITSQAYNAGSTTSYIASVSAACPSITFRHLPPTSLPPDFSTTSPHHETLVLELLRLNNPNVHAALTSISKNHVVHALVVDFFCASALSVARELSIPCYYFFTSGASVLTVFLYFPTLHKLYTKSYKDLNAVLHVPEMPPLPSSDIAKPAQDRNDRAYELFLESSKNMATSAGIIINTFEKLEPRAVQAIRDGECVPGGPTPPLYCIGPLITSGEGKREGSGNGMSDCLTWLDSQPKGSIAFLCFGSLGVFSVEQLKEIATGLERSGQRFLWVVRNPPQDADRKTATSAMPDPDLARFCQKGERGLVVKTWAPQVEVLNHSSVGGFVTHCGWNSVLEAVCAGVPMVAWPLYAEQRQNKGLMVEEIKIALPVDESESGLVCSEEVEKRVRELMESEKGEIMRERVKSLKEEAKAALSPGWSSSVELRNLVESWKRE